MSQCESELMHACAVKLIISLLDERGIKIYMFGKQKWSVGKQLDCRLHFVSMECQLKSNYTVKVFSNRPMKLIELVDELGWK